MGKTKPKAVLVLNEMPKRCDDCWLANFQREDCYCFCMGLQKPVDYDNGLEEMDSKNGDWRWNKCPLRELPKKLGDKTISELQYYAEKYRFTILETVSALAGYDACLLQIEGNEDQDDISGNL